MDHSLTEDHNYLQDKKRSLEVLIVDDHFETVEALRLLFLDGGHTVTVVEEGPRCITLCQDQHYDVIFMDYHMDGLDGDAVIEIIRESSKVRTTHLFVFTADHTTECVHKFSQLDIDGILFKPTSPEVILMLIRGLENRFGIDEQMMKKLQHESEGTLLFFEKKTAP